MAAMKMAIKVELTSHFHSHKQEVEVGALNLKVKGKSFDPSLFSI